MKDRILKNQEKVHFLAEKLANLHKNQYIENKRKPTEDYIHSKDRIYAEISIRTVLEKIYKNIDLNEADLITLHNYVKGNTLYLESQFLEDNDKIKCLISAEKLINDIDNYEKEEMEVLKDAYGSYNREISEILESNKKEKQRLGIFNKIRRKGVR